MRAWRIVGTGRVELDGEESREKGGRWHQAGRPLVYAASSSALALAEFLVHMEGDAGPLQVLEIEVPDRLRTDQIQSHTLPHDWRAPRHSACCRSGENWLNRPHHERGAILLVPSAVVPLEQNILLDPQHPDMQHVAVARVHEFELDDRLLNAGHASE